MITTSHPAENINKLIGIIFLKEHSGNSGVEKYNVKWKINESG